VLKRHREIDGEDAAFPGQVADVKGAAVGLDSLPADGQPETQAGAVGAPALERTEKLFADARRQPAALVLDLDANLARGRHGPKEDTAIGTAELEPVAEEIRNGGREEQAVGVYGDLGRHCPDGQMNPSGSCLEDCRGLHVPDEIGQHDARMVLSAGAEPDCGQRTVRSLPKTHQRASEHGACPSADSHPAATQDLERDHRGRDQVALLVCESSEPPHLALRQRVLAQAKEFRHCPGDGLVEAVVESAELLGRDRRTERHRQLGEVLAYVTVIVDDLPDGEPGSQHFFAVLRRRCRHR
jgi:hypothetical protein